MQTIDNALDRLEKSKFRSSFKLNETDIDYINLKGLGVIESHAADFVRSKIAPAEPLKDGKQTPTHGHPVFKAQHATATCCRGCLYKWYKVPMHCELNESQQKKIVNLIMAWIDRQMNKA